MNIQRLRAKYAFNAHRRARFYQKMALFSKNGKALSESITIIHNRYVTEKNILAVMTSEWMRRTAESGASMIVAEGWIPDSEIGLILAGEGSGDIRVGFLEAEKVARVTMAMQKEIRAATIQPIVGLLLGYGILVGFRLFFAKILLEMASVDQWPTQARALYYFSGFLTHQWWLIAAVGLVVYTQVARSLSNYTGGLRPFLDQWVPPWSIYRVTVAAGFLIAISGLLKQGRDMDSAIKEYGRAASPYAKKFLQRILVRKAAGMPEAFAMDVGLLDSETAGDLKDMAGTSGLDAVMQTLGDDALIQSVEKVKSQAGLIRYLLMVVLSIIIVWIFTSFLNTSYKAAEVQRKQLSTGVRN